MGPVIAVVSGVAGTHTRVGELAVVHVLVARLDREHGGPSRRRARQPGALGRRSRGAHHGWLDVEGLVAVAKVVCRRVAVEAGGGHNRLGLRPARPPELHRGVADNLLVLELDGVEGVGHEGNGAIDLGAARVPLVNDEQPVYPELGAVIHHGVKREDLGEGRADHALPPRTKVARANVLLHRQRGRGDRAAAAPVEVNGGVHALKRLGLGRDPKSVGAVVGQVIVLKVGAKHAAGLHDLAADIVYAATRGCVVDLVPTVANVDGACLIGDKAPIVLGGLETVGVGVVTGEGGVCEHGKVKGRRFLDGQGADIVECILGLHSKRRQDASSRQRQRRAADPRGARARGGGKNVEDEGGVGDVVRLKETRAADDRRHVVVAAPLELEGGSRGRVGGDRLGLEKHFIVLVLDKVNVASRRGAGEGERGPLGDDEAVVHPQLDPLVRLGNASLKREHVGRLRVRLMVLVVEYLEETRPANRKALPVRQRQGAEVPGDVCAEAALGVLDVKVDAVLGASCHGHAELHVIVIGGVEPRSLREGGVDLVVALYRGEVGHLVAAAEGEEARRGHDGGRAERLDSLGEGGAGARVDGVGLLGAVDCVA
mmetsp:Transcript_24300/g.56178  ORF Transcript_24300/g.56178 Transcript_24300/m.56178 type:complete len:599 (+) Transcript_24300:3153-4949(+)